MREITEALQWQQRGPNWVIGAWVWRTFVTLKKPLGRPAEQDPPDLFEMGGAYLDLVRKRVHVADAALERAAREDRVEGRFRGPVRDARLFCYDTSCRRANSENGPPACISSL